MKFKLLLFICILLVLSSFAFAVKYETTLVQGGGMYDIEYPKLFYHEQDVDIELSFYVINYTGIVLKDSITCELELYNSKGNHIYKTKLYGSNDNDDYTFNISGRNFSTIGDYYYKIYCKENVTNLEGGFASIPFRVTPDGEPNDNLDTTSGVSLSLFLFIIIGGLFALGLKFEFSENIITQLILRRCCFVIGIWMMTYTTTMMMTIADAASLPLLGEMKTLMFIFGWAGYSAMVYLVVKTVFDVVKNYNNMMLNKRMSDD